MKEKTKWRIDFFQKFKNSKSKSNHPNSYKRFKLRFLTNFLQKFYSTSILISTPLSCCLYCKKICLENKNQTWNLLDMKGLNSFSSFSRYWRRAPLETSETRNNQSTKWCCHFSLRTQDLRNKNKNKMNKIALKQNEENLFIVL